MDNVRFVKLDKNNFCDYADFVMVAESVFPESLRTDIDEYEEIINQNDSIGFVLFHDDKFVGVIFGCESIREFEGNANMPVFKGRVIYIYSIAVLPNFQGKGFGSLLMNLFIKESNAKGYVFVAGNYRLNGSYRLIKKYNVVFEEVTPDWEGSGEDFVYCIIKL